jgi:hypothetical protein
MSFWSNTVTRFSAAISAFMNPDGILGQMSVNDRIALYTLAWNYYRSRQFSSEVADWTTYLNERGLYKHTRLIYNPVPSIVDFYVDNIWKSDDETRKLNDSLVTPLAANTEPNIVDAVAVLDLWSNFDSEKQKIKRYTAATGNCLLEMIDDNEREKILQKTVWAGFVKEFELNETGDLQSYILEYDVWDYELKRSYKYKKEVDKVSFRYFRDDRQYDEVENFYGYCPAVWFKHIDDGSDYGLPACNHLEKVNEVNSLASHLHDNIHKDIESAKVLGFDADPSTIQYLSGSETADPRLDRILYAIKGNVSMSDLSGDLKLDEAKPYLEMLIASFTDDYPELQAAAVIKENSQLSGAALERMLTPAQNRLDNAQGYYNRQLIKFRQMQISAAGWRTRNGWLNDTPQQQVFAPFNLDSYEKGKIDFQLKQSRLISETEAEREDILIKKANRAVSLTGIVNQQEQLKIVGYVEKDIPTVAADTTEPKQLGAGLPVEE